MSECITLIVLHGERGWESEKIPSFWQEIQRRLETKGGNGRYCWHYRKDTRHISSVSGKCTILLVDLTSYSASNGIDSSEINDFLSTASWLQKRFCFLVVPRGVEKPEEEMWSKMYQDLVKKYKGKVALIFRCLKYSNREREGRVQQNNQCDIYEEHLNYAIALIAQEEVNLRLRMINAIGVTSVGGGMVGVALVVIGLLVGYGLWLVLLGLVLLLSILIFAWERTSQC